MKKLLLALSLSFPLLAATEAPKDVAPQKEVVAKVKVPKATSEKLARAFALFARDTALWSATFIVFGYIFGSTTPSMDRAKWGAILGALWGTANAADDFLKSDKVEAFPRQRQN